MYQNAPASSNIYKPPDLAMRRPQMNDIFNPPEIGPHSFPIAGKPKKNEHEFGSLNGALDMDSMKQHQEYMK